MKRIGVLTGGGDCPGLNAVLRAIYRTASARGYELLGIEDGFAGLIDLDRRRPYGNRMMSEEMVRGILPRGGTILGSSNSDDPFHYVAPGSDREEDVSDRVVDNARRLGLDALICIGGDGTMTIAHGLAGKGLRVVGVPKTIDNDLLATDYTFGFDTALHTAVDALDKLHTTAESHDRVMLLEVMGRHAGWIALHAGIAGDADVILIPEIPYSAAAVLAKIERRRAQGRYFSIIAVAEGAVPIGGCESYIEQARPGRAGRLGGAAERVAAALRALEPTLDCRVTVLGHLQRGGSPSPKDRLLGTRFGVAAVELVERGQFDHMVCLRTPHIRSVPIAEAIARRNVVDPQGELCAAARAVGICLGSPDEL
ncbi:MAG: ATP-dependent 6-phosphofructokinase [Myxococcales bacterium]|nr:6-phosphofructokinase [Myxococcota bacterium]MDW8282289.1 ATP-dependent 6-phosphofructokinase [Myxococcales bacterium]